MPFSTKTVRQTIAVFFAMMLYNFWIIAKFTESGGGDPALWALCLKEAEFLRALLVLIRPGLCPDTRRIPAAEPGKVGDSGAAGGAPAATGLMLRQGRRRRAHCRNPAPALYFREISGGARAFLGQRLGGALPVLPESRPKPRGGRAAASHFFTNWPLAIWPRSLGTPSL